MRALPTTERLSEAEALAPVRASVMISSSAWLRLRPPLALTRVFSQRTLSGRSVTETARLFIR